MVASRSKDVRADLAAVEARGVPSAGLADFVISYLGSNGNACRADGFAAATAFAFRPSPARTGAGLGADPALHLDGAQAITRIAYAAADPGAVRPRFAAIWGG